MLQCPPDKVKVAFRHSPCSDTGRRAVFLFIEILFLYRVRLRLCRRIQP